MYQIDSAYIPADRSSHARVALALAAQLKVDAPTVAHVIDDWKPHVRDVLFPYAALGEDDRAFEAEFIEAAREGLAGYLDVAADEVRVDMQDPATHLTQEIQARRPDVVLMGAFGAKGPRPDALGSLASAVLRASSAPVWLVRDFGSAPRVERVLAAVDLSTSSRDVISHALGVALQLEAELELVYVLPDPCRGDAAGVLEAHLRLDERRLMKEARARFEALFASLVDGVEVDFPRGDQAARALEKRTVLFGDPAMTLVDYAHERDADLLVLGRRQAGKAGRTLGRVTRAVVSNAPCHSMVIPIG